MKLFLSWLVFTASVPALVADTLYVPSTTLTTSSTGHVGINTSGPTATFQVVGAAAGAAGNHTAMFYSEGAFAQWPAVAQNISGSTSSTEPMFVGLNLENSATDGIYLPFLTFSRNSASSGAFNPIISAIGSIYTGQGPDSNWGAGALTFWTAGTAVHGVLERMRIDQSGNIGIGTTSPGSRKLKVQSSNSTNDVGAEISLGRTTGTNYGLIVSTDGVGADLNQGILTTARDGSANFGLRIYNVLAGSSNYALYSDSAAKSYFQGSIGIGTTTPAALLDICASLGSTQTAASTLSHYYNSETNPRWGIGRDYLGSGQAALAFGAGGSSALDVYIGRDSSAGLQIQTGGSGSPRLTILSGGNVGIGTTSPSHKLAVDGTIRAHEVIVDTGWSDYVFADDYRLAPLAEVESHIKAERHLPGIPSAQEVAEHGVSMGEMQAKLLAKIEELTLHVIAQEKELAAQRQELRSLKNKSQEISPLSVP